MTNRSTPPERIAEVKQAPASTRSAERAADAVWRRLCEGVSAGWLEDIRGLRTDGDDFDASLDIWSVALIAALRDPTRRETASVILARLRKLSDDALEPSEAGG